MLLNISEFNQTGKPKVILSLVFFLLRKGIEDALKYNHPRHIEQVAYMRSEFQTQGNHFNYVS